MKLTEEEYKAIIEALEYYLNRWPSESNREEMISALEKIKMERIVNP